MGYVGQADVSRSQGLWRFSCCSALVTTFLALASPAVAQPFAYISHELGNTISVIDTATNEVVATIPLIDAFGVAVDPAGTRGYVTSLSGTVAVIDTTTHTVVASIPVSSTPAGVALNPAGTRIYVTHATTSGNTVSVIDTATNAVIDSVVVGIGPFGVVVNPAGTRVYVTNDSDPAGTMSVIDASNNTVIDTIAVGFNPRGVAINPAGSRIYVGNSTGNTIQVIDAASNMIVDTVTVGDWPIGIAVNPAGTRVYVANFQSDSVSVIDTASNSVEATIAVGDQPMGVAIDSAGTTVYVANAGSDNVSVIDTATNTVIDTVLTGAVPIAFGRFVGVSCADGDGDNFCAVEDCDDTNSTTFPDAPEINDGLDNQCPGDFGFGVTDEISGASGFTNPADDEEYSWPSQVGATVYEAARSSTPDFFIDCVLFSTIENTWSDGERPTIGEVFYYLVRSVAPNVGSWGQDSSNIERTVNCPSFS